MTEQLTRLTLPADPGKQQEITHFRNFVEDLPASCYLRSILTDTIGEVDRQIRDDMAVPEFLHDIWREKFEQSEQRDALKKELAELKKQVKDKIRQRDQLEQVIDQARHDAHNAAAKFRTAYDTLDDIG